MSDASTGRRHLPARSIGELALPIILPLISAGAAAGERPRLPQRVPVGTIVQVRPLEAARQSRISCQLPVAGCQFRSDNWQLTTDNSHADAAPAQAPTLSLADCIRIALEQQPALAAYRASLASAEANSRGLDSLRIPAFIVRELPVRRQQAALGVTVASAALDQAERETIYAVKRTYVTVLYARAQVRVTSKVVTELSDALENAKRLLGKEGAPRDLTQNAVDKNTAYLRLAEMRQIDARLGVQRATAALREAMAVGPDFAFQIAAEPLPEPGVTVQREEVVNLALARRGELVQAMTGAEVTCLEIKAQGTSCLPTKQTFASVVDIHSRPIPQGISDTDYRPGAVGPEYPTTLAGPRWARVERARDLNSRATAVVDKTRNLIALEAEDAYLKWEEAARKVPKAREAARVSEKLSSDTLKDFKGGQAVPYRDVLEAAVLAAQAGASYNEARYQQLLALAALERVTAGGFSSGLGEDRPNPP